MKMKHVLLSLLVLLVASSLFFVSCGDDDDGDVKLAGTVWVFELDMGMLGKFEVFEIKFIDATKAEMWTVADPDKGVEAEKEEEGTYTVSGNKVTMISDGETMVGTINGNKMTIPLSGEDLEEAAELGLTELVFTKR